MMLRTSNILVSSSWKRLSVSVKKNSFQVRLLSTKEVPKNGSSIPSSNKPTPTPQKSGGGGGFGTFLFFSAAVAGGLGYIAYEKEMGNPTAEHIASQPYVGDVIEPIVKLLKTAGILTATKPSAPKAAKEEYHHKTTAEIIEESHKSDPYVLPTPNDAVDTGAKHSDETVSSKSAADSHVSEQETVSVTETAVDDIAQAVSEAVSEEQHAVSISTADAEQIISEALSSDATASAVDESPVEESKKGLAEVSAEISLKAAGVTTSSREILQSVAKSSVALRQELETLMLKDIQTMDAPALRLRVTQLATELFERLSWENMRLNHAIAQVEEELTERYERLFAKQRKELEFEVEKILFEKDKALAESTSEQTQAVEAKYAAQMQQAIKAQAEGFQATLQQSLKEQHDSLVEEFQSQANQHHAMLRKQHNDQLLQTQTEIENVRQQVIACQAVLNQLGGTVEDTLNSHSISTAVLTLESLLSQPSTLLKKVSGGQGGGVKAHLDRVRSLAHGDELVTSVVNSLPSRVQQDGAPTLSELQVRFAIMREEARKAALSPEQAPKLIGQAIGTVLATISSSPSGYVSGPGVEESLARAAFFLERGKLKEAVGEVKSMEGYAKVIAQDWISLAEDRLLVDQAIRALKANSILRHRHFQK